MKSRRRSNLQTRLGFMPTYIARWATSAMLATGIDGPGSRWLVMRSMLSGKRSSEHFSNREPWMHIESPVSMFADRSATRSGPDRVAQLARVLCPLFSLNLRLCLTASASAIRRDRQSAPNCVPEGFVALHGCRSPPESLARGPHKRSRASSHRERLKNVVVSREMTTMTPTTMSDRDLIHATVRAASNERCATVELRGAWRQS